MPVIYRALNKTSGKSYVGYSLSLPDRIQRHLYNAKTGQRGRFYDALRKYGESDFSWEILYEGDDAFNREDEFISKFNSLAEGYNMTEGGRGVPGAVKHTIWINDGKNHKRVRAEELHEWVSKGWSEGRIGLVRTIRMSEASKKRIGRKNKRHGILAKLNALRIACPYCKKRMNPGTLARHKPICRSSLSNTSAAVPSSLFHGEG